MLNTVKQYILDLDNSDFNVHWVDYLISVGEQMHNLEIKSISDKDLTVDNLQRELYDIGKEFWE